MLQADDEDDAMDQQMKSPFGSSFRTFDATDYKPIGNNHYSCTLHVNTFLLNQLKRTINIYFNATFIFPATVDVKRNIFDLCTDNKDCYLAVIEVLLFELLSKQ